MNHSNVCGPASVVSSLMWVAVTSMPLKKKNFFHCTLLQMYKSQLQHETSRRLAGLAGQVLLWDFILVTLKKFNEQSGWRHIWKLPDGWLVRLHEDSRWGYQHHLTWWRALAVVLKRGRLGPDHQHRAPRHSCLGSCKIQPSYSEQRWRPKGSPSNVSSDNMTVAMTISHCVCTSRLLSIINVCLLLLHPATSLWKLWSTTSKTARLDKNQANLSMLLSHWKRKN